MVGEIERLSVDRYALHAADEAGKERSRQPAGRPVRAAEPQTAVSVELRSAGGRDGDDRFLVVNR